jgi:NAD(P)H dehydrogenase (quinone)
VKHVIVLAHPRPSSFTASLARAYGATLTAMGHGVQVRDLYALGFNPVLAAGELGGAVPPEDVAREQAEIAAADAIAFFYPLWWASMPAILKGYIDRVLSCGFAYEIRAAGLHGLLRGKKGVIVTLSAAPTAILDRTGDWDAIRILQDAHIFRTCGVEIVAHEHFGEILPDLADGDAHAHLDRVRTLARTCFAAAKAS